MRNIFKILDYKDIKKEIKRFDIDKKYLTSFGKLDIKLHTKQQIKHSQTIMIDEFGIFLLLIKSNKQPAKILLNKLISYQ